MSRFTITYAPAALPGSCRSCGGAKTPMVDMQYQEDGHGAVYYCLECIGEVANILGYATSEQHNSLIADLQKEQLLSKKLAEVNVQYNYIKDSMEKAGYAKLSTSTDTGTSSMFTADGSGISPELSLPTGGEYSATANQPVNGTAEGTSEPLDVKNLGAVRTGRVSTSSAKQPRI